jgi:hypothetical protein
MGVRVKSSSPVQQLFLSAAADIAPRSNQIKKPAKLDEYPWQLNGRNEIFTIRFMRP